MWDIVVFLASLWSYTHKLLEDYFVRYERGLGTSLALPFIFVVLAVNEDSCAFVQCNHIKNLCLSSSQGVQTT